MKLPESEFVVKIESDKQLVARPAFSCNHTVENKPLANKHNPGQVVLSIMGNDTANHLPDPAAVFAAALSLWQRAKKQERLDERLSLSEAYNGMDEFMRVIMRAGTRFEEWACGHVVFDALDEVWPYLLEEKFGEACVALKDFTSLNEFSDSNCLEVALRLRLPVKADGSLPIPVDVSAINPIAESEFRRFRIQTVRECSEGVIEPFISFDDPFDERFSPLLFGFYGVCDDGLLEHIADFDSYAAAVSLARKLAPGIQFSDTPYSC